MAEWYYMFNGQQNGPVSGSQLKSLAATGGLGPEDLVWNQSMADWVAAQRVRGLTFARSVAAAVPRQPISTPAQVAAPPPAEAPQEESYSPLPAASFAGYEAAPEQAPQPLAYSQPGMEPVSAKTIEYLRQTQPWVRLFSIILFTVVGFMLLGAVIALLVIISGGAMLARFSPSSGSASGASTVAGGALIVSGMIVMLIYAALAFFPAMFLMKYASAIKRLLVSRQSKDLEAAMKAQKTYWMFIGIVALIVISLNLIGFLIMLLGGLR